LSHADTSAQSSVDNTGATFIQDVSLDGFGHVTGLTSTTITPSLIGAAPTASPVFTGDLSVDTNTFFVDATNNRVGVLTTTPTTALDVNGTANMTTLSIGGTAVTATAAELNFVDGVTSNIQTQINALSGGGGGGGGFEQTFMLMGG
jgi:hypothetical protein